MLLSFFNEIRKCHLHFSMKNAILIYMKYNRNINAFNGNFFLFGPRGTGKSTWLRDTYPDALFVDLLREDLKTRHEANPERLAELVDGSPDVHTVIIDEVQRVSAILPVVHRLIERDGNARQYILTGSSARKLKRSGVDLLAGRAVMKFCHPLLASEMGDDFKLEDALVRGMIPLVISADNWRDTLATYMALYIREEVQYEGLVRNLPAFARFLEAISFSHGALYSATDISRECGVSRPMVDNYLSILVDLLVAARLPPFTRRAKRRLVGHDKFYFFDAGVFRSVRPCGPLDSASEIDGAALEGLVFQQLRAWIDYSNSGDTLSFWRTHSGQEVDFVVYGGNRFEAIEVKNSARLTSKDFSGLKAFASDYPEAKRTLLYRGTERLFQNGVHCIPVADFLRELRVES